MAELKKIAIIGRPNVGKSTFFNRLAGKKSALVSELPGMTRDRNEKIGTLLDLKFCLIDAAGVVPNANDPISQAMNTQSLLAISEAEIIFFMIDADENNIIIEKEIADWLRISLKEVSPNKSVILLANKAENAKSEESDFYSLGFGEPVYVSASHNLGFGDLYKSLSTLLSDDENKQTTDKSSKPFFSIALLGRPNVGKSTLLNNILKQERVITSEISGTTRDSISTYFQFDDKLIEFIDTAGSRKNKNANSIQENIAVLSTNSTIERAHVAILIVDALQPFEVRDLQLASQVIKEGRGLIIALNKWDLISPENQKDLLKLCEFKLGKKLSNCYKLLPISALFGKNVNTLIKESIKIYHTWNKVIPVKKLNQWLGYVVNKTPPSLVDKKCPKFAFIKQVSARPPSFIILGTKIDLVKENYIRYLLNSMRQDFGLENVPIRLKFKYKLNPYKQT